jgi:lysozyme
MTEAPQLAIDLIKGFENCKLVAYLDKKTNGVPTIGYGTTIYNNGERVKLGDTITPEDAENELVTHCHQLADGITACVYSELNENQLSALISLAYNIGMSRFQKSTMRKLLNLLEFEAAANQFDRWVYDDKVKVDGLVNRRAKEKAVFLSNEALTQASS